jgi:hypothetical protein
VEDSLATLPKARIKGKQHNAPAFDVRSALYGDLGKDLTQILGQDPSRARKRVAEWGTNLCAFKNAKNVTSLLCLIPGLIPGTEMSGGKRLPAWKRRSSSRAAARLRLAAVKSRRSDIPPGALYRRPPPQGAQRQTKGGAATARHDFGFAMVSIRSTVVRDQTVGLRARSMISNST